MTPKSVTQRGENRAKASKIVNLTVKYQHKSAAPRRHRLVSVFREIHHGEPSMTQAPSGGPVPIKTLAVRTAIRNCGGHALQYSFRRHRLRPEFPKTRCSTTK